MASKKAQLLEKSLIEEMHPFAARNSPLAAPQKPEIATVSQPSEDVDTSITEQEERTIKPFGRSPVIRNIARFSFELFQDQMDSLREFSIKEKINGGKGSMSQMMREAVDAYISKRKKNS
jgi:hypothetical protein